jgi:hypothetical protein
VRAQRRRTARQVSGDCNAIDYGGVFLHTDRSYGRTQLTYIDVQPCAEYIGSESTEYKNFAWVRVSYVEKSDLISLLRDAGCDVKERTPLHEVKELTVEHLLCGGNASLPWDEEPESILDGYTLRDYAGDALTNEVRAARKEAALAYANARFGREG